MSQPQVPLLLFVPPVQGSTPERMLGEAVHANALDLIDRALDVPALRPIIVATPAPAWPELAGLPVELVADEPGEPFHFGRRLRTIVERYRVDRFLYIGAGAGALLGEADLADLATRAATLERGVLANNLYSADWFALAGAKALDTIALPESDNDLPFRLQAAGLPAQGLPPSAATRFDLDTPTDLLVASLHPRIGPALRRCLRALPLDPAPARRVLAEMDDPQGEVLIYGRLSATAWQRLEALPCQTRVFAEERGMRASGRQERGGVHAWLGRLYELVGARAFFAALAGACTGAIFDTRVLFAHLGLGPSTADRFYSDLLRPEDVAHPAVRELTAAALQAPVPLLLGGHSLVSGGLLALAEMAQG